MLPIYKLFSLVLRVFSRPLINLTKRYHANNQISNQTVKIWLYRLGNWFHRTQVRINRRYLRMNTNNAKIQPLSQGNAVDKGIQFFYQLVFYSIAIGFPIYELYRASQDGKIKDQKVSSRVKLICEKLEKINENSSSFMDSLSLSQWRNMALRIDSQYFLFRHYPTNLFFSQHKHILKKHSPFVVEGIKSKRYLY